MRQLIVICLVLTMGLSGFMNPGESLQSYISSLNPKVYSEFRQFKVDFKRQYGNDHEELSRLKKFKFNYDMIEAHNKHEPPYSYTVGINEFADWGEEDFQQILIPKEVYDLRSNDLGYSGNETKLEVNSDSLVAAPTCMDHSAKDQPPIKNQMQCGSCWAFAAISTIEGELSLKHGRLHDLSDMQINSCSKYGWFHGRKLTGNGCGGGWQELAYIYGEKNGIGETKEYPYCDACSDSTCSSYVTANGCHTDELGCHASEKIRHPIVKTPSYQESFSKSEQSLMSVLPQHVVSVAMAPCDQFFSYKSGVFTGSYSCNHNSIHSLHAVTLVGYGKTTDASAATPECDDTGSDYFYLRNSWSTRWGASGYMLVKRTPGNTGQAPEKIPYDGWKYPITQPVGEPGPDPKPEPSEKGNGCKLCYKACGGKFPVKQSFLGEYLRWNSFYEGLDAGCSGSHNIHDGKMAFCCGEPTTSSPGTCRVCASCGNDYNIVSGQMAVNHPDWWWYASGYGQGCSGSFTTNVESNTKYLCCKDKQVCALCNSCGGRWPEQAGKQGVSFSSAPSFRQYGDQCSGDIGQRYFTEGVSLCCISPGAAAKFNSTKIE